MINVHVTQERRYAYVIPSAITVRILDNICDNSPSTKITSHRFSRRFLFQFPRGTHLSPPGIMQAEKSRSFHNAGRCLEFKMHFTSLRSPHILLPTFSRALSFAVLSISLHFPRPHAASPAAHSFNKRHMCLYERYAE